MRDVAILGAGDLGGAIAYVLARRGSAAAIRLISSNSLKLSGTEKQRNE